MTEHEEWIAPTGVRAVSDDAEDTAIPDGVINDPDLSLMAKGIYALVLSYQGKPVNPYEDAFESEEDIREAIDELVSAGLIVRKRRPE